MPDVILVGEWVLNANGSVGTMVIDRVEPGGKVALRMTFSDIGREEVVSGTWDPASKTIALLRVLGGNVTQSYTGFLGGNHPSNVILAGGFTQSDIPQTAPRTIFGWSAQLRRPAGA